MFVAVRTVIRAVPMGTVVAPFAVRMPIATDTLAKPQAIREHVPPHQNPTRTAMMSTVQGEPTQIRGKPHILQPTAATEVLITIATEVKKRMPRTMDQFAARVLVNIQPRTW